MNAPDKIYIHEASAPELAEPFKAFHIEYIRKDALLEWMEKINKNWNDCIEQCKALGLDKSKVFYCGAQMQIMEIIDKINEM